MSATMEPEKKHRRKIDSTLWRKVEREACEGVSFHTLALAYGIAVSTIESKAKRERWRTPRRVVLERRAALSGGERVSSTPPEKGQKTQLSCINEAPKPQLPNNQLSTLLSLAESGPPEFAKSAASFLQSLLAENAGSLEINNLRDWKDVFTMWRQAAGLDKQVVSGGSAPLVNPLRTVSRRAVVDAEIVAGGSVDDWEP